MNVSSTLDNEGKNINLKQLVRWCWRHWYWFALSCFVCGMIWLFYILAANNKYSVVSSFMIRDLNQSGLSMLPQSDMLAMLGMNTHGVDVESELVIFNSRAVMEQTIKDLNLRTTYRKRKGLRWEPQYVQPDLRICYAPLVEDTIRSGLSLTLKCKADGYVLRMKSKLYGTEVYRFANLTDTVNTLVGPVTFAVSCMPQKGDVYRISTPELSMQIFTLRKLLSGKQVKKGAKVINVTMETDDPLCAIDMMNRMTEIYMMDAVIEKNRMIADANEFIEQRLQLITEELADAEEEVEKYKKDNHIVSLSEEAQLYVLNSDEYQKRRAELETQKTLVAYLKEFMMDPAKKGVFVPANIGLSDEGLINAINNYNGLLLRKMRLERSASDSNPLFTQLEQQIDVSYENILTSIASTESGLAIRQTNLERQAAEYSGRISDVPTQEREYVEIRRNKELKQQMYLYLYKKREENAISQISSVTRVKVIDAPHKLPRPTAPRKLVLLVVAGMMGLFIPVLVYFILLFLNTGVRVPEKAAALLSMPLLARLRRQQNGSGVLCDTASPLGEDFRTLRTALQLRRKEPTGSCVLLVTSARKEEGKTSVVLNLSASYAALGKRVAVVELNLRTPVLAEYLGLRDGLTDWLQDKTGDEAPMSHNSVQCPGVDIYAAVKADYPNELLQSPRMKELFAFLRKHYDVVLVDSAALLDCSDTLLLEQWADSILWVVASGACEPDCLTQAAAMLAAPQKAMLVFNKADV
ncbi:MAG: hypothetical protein IJV55_05245 [Paludibacteraceae bacterium]|nr:hypothetical protein [Paludibacteraceae bacterium]